MTNYPRHGHGQTWTKYDNFSPKFEDSMATPHYLSLPIILSVAHIIFVCFSMPYEGFQKWGYPQIIHFSRIFPHKYPPFWDIPHLWKPPYRGLPTLKYFYFLDVPSLTTNPPTLFKASSIYRKTENNGKNHNV